MSTPNTSARKRIAAGFAAVLGAALLAFEAMPAQAAPPPHAPAHGYRRKQQQTRQTYRRYPSNQRNSAYRRNRGFPYSSTDLDGDGIPNLRDRDIDGDGIPNSRDRDMDGDGIRNTRDVNDYGWGDRPVDNRNRRTVRRPGWRPAEGTFRNVMNQRTPRGYYRDRAGRLIRRPSTVKRGTFTTRRVNRVGDKDGDGIRNRRDRDIDGDGIRNRRDRNMDGDKVRDRRDRHPRNPRRR